MILIYRTIALVAASADKGTRYEYLRLRTQNRLFITQSQVLKTSFIDYFWTQELCIATLECMLRAVQIKALRSQRKLANAVARFILSEILITRKQQIIRIDLIIDTETGDSGDSRVCDRLIKGNGIETGVQNPRVDRRTIVNPIVVYPKHKR